MEPLGLLIIDGRHLLWRAASTFGDLSAKDAEGDEHKTGAIYGFLRIGLKVWQQFGGITFVAWDNDDGPVARRRLYPEYKGHKGKKDSDDPSVLQRREILELMRSQEAVLRTLLPIMGIRQANAMDWEADDVIATLCTRFGSNHRIGILSGDRDLLQLVSDKVSLIRPMKKGEFKIETPETIRAELGLSPKQVLDLKALAGDASDNIPGARGIGPKTATKLIQEHGSWQAVMDWVGKNEAKSKWHEHLLDAAMNGMVSVSATLVALNHSAPLEITPTARDGKQTFMALTRLKFNSLLSDGRREALMSMGG